MSLTQRNYQFELRAQQDEKHGHHVVGRPIVYNSRTDIGPFDEIIEPGALEKTNLKDVRFLVNHNTSMIPLARSRNNNENSTMQMTVDETGMEIRVDLDVERNSDARSLYSAIERGDISGMSFMFSVDEESWENLESDHPTRRILRIGAVAEVSAVTFPAYEATEITARDNSALDSARLALESARSHPPDGGTGDNLIDLEKAKNRNRSY